MYNIITTFKYRITVYSVQRLVIIRSTEKPDSYSVPTWNTLYSFVGARQSCDRLSRRENAVWNLTQYCVPTSRLVPHRHNVIIIHGNLSIHLSIYIRFGHEVWCKSTTHVIRTECLRRFWITLEIRVLPETIR